MEKIWVDPRTVKRRHVGVYTLAPDGEKLMIDRKVGLEWVSSKGDLVLKIYAPLRMALLRESVLINEGYNPLKHTVGDPNRVAGLALSLGFDEGLNNRIYIGSGMSVARIQELEAGNLDFILAAERPVDVRTYPSRTDLRAEIQKFYPLPELS